jgi:uncharacterized paraquat-inducible protein A
MAIRRRIEAGIDDIRAIVFECKSCAMRITLPANKTTEVAHLCPTCNAVWWRGNDLSSHVNTSGPAAAALIQAIRTLAAMARDNEDNFRIFLEFEDLPGRSQK